jgi:hypothetical protein
MPQTGIIQHSPYVPKGYRLAFADEFDSILLDQNGNGDSSWVPWFIGWEVHHLAGNSDDYYKAWENYVGMARNLWA